jgi:hypothetical protein
MARAHGSDQVKAGFYLNLNSWAVTTISGKGGQLPGGTTEVFYRVPTPALLVFAPLMGALFAIFLPFIGIAMVVKYAAERAAVGARDLTHSMVATASPAWRPGTAHLTGEPAGKAKTDAKKDESADGRLKAIEDEIAKKEQGQQ